MRPARTVFRKQRVNDSGLPFLRAVSIVALLLIASACSQSPADLPEPSDVQLRDVAEDVGIDFVHGAFRWEESLDPVAMMGAGVCWLDFNDDGWMDLYAVNTYAQDEHGRWTTGDGLPTNALFKNTEGLFSDVSEGSGADLSVRGNGCVAGDLDNDGDTDLYVTTERSNVLLWNNGDGTFTEGAEPAGVAGYGWHTGATIGDVNGDGFNDIFVSGYVDMNNRIPDATLGFPNTHKGERDLLYLSDGGQASSVTFTEVASEVGIETWEPEYGLGAALTDVDNDGDLDLYVANDTNPNRLYRNDVIEGGLGFVFTEIGSAAGVADENSGMGVAIADIDADGRLDTFVTNFGHQLHGVYLNRTADVVRFVDGLDRLGAPDLGSSMTGWGTRLFDIDNDADLDVIIANGDVPIEDLSKDGAYLDYYEWDNDVLTDRGQEMGVWALGRMNARAVAGADFDNDGDIDIAVSVIGGRLRLLENAGPKGGSVVVTAEPATPGTRVYVRFPSGALRTGEIQAGGSYLSSEDPRMHFGIGDAQWVNITVRWPDGSESTQQKVPPGTFVKVGKP